MKSNNIISYLKLVICILSVIVSAGLMACSNIHNNGSKSSSNDLKPLIIGSDNYVPYSYLDSDGNFTGIDVEIAREACSVWVIRSIQADCMGYKDIYLKGAVDCLWGCFTMTGREDKYNWAGPYMYSRQIVVVNKDSGIENLDDLNGKRVAVQVTSKPEYILSNTNTPQVGVLYSMSTMEELYASMRKGYVDAIAGHENAMKVFVQSNEEHFGVLREELSVSELGIAFSFDNDSGIDKKLTGVLNEMRADGTIQSIAEKYGVDVSMAVWGN
ncbi:MAG: substrate-binding periplasmic protein [Lachnospira pectinoschiza]